MPCQSAQSMDQVYAQACSSLGCVALPFIAGTLAKSSAGAGLTLSGNCKDLFDHRLNDVQLVALCEAFRMACPERLTLSFNEIGNTGAKALAQLLQLPLSNSNGDAHADDLQQQQQGLAGLLHLDIHSNSITDTGADSLADALAQPSCRLQGLVLSCNEIGDTGVCALAAALQQNKSLQTLDLSNTGMAEAGVIMLAATLADHNRSIKTLTISSPLLQQRPQFDTVVHLSRMLAVNDALQVLGMSKAAITDGALEQLVQYGFNKSSSVREIDLSANKLSPLSGKHIQSLLTNRQGAIEVLDLHNNRLEDEGAVHIAQCLHLCHGLKSLDLRNCHIGDKGLSALLQAAGKAPCASQLVLRLWGNTWGQDATRALDELRRSPSSQHCGRLAVDVVTYVADNGVAVAHA